jgi:hypothetical protein
MRTFVRILSGSLPRYTSNRICILRALSLFAFLVFTCAHRASAQLPDTSTQQPPDAPTPQTVSVAPSAPAQTKRILGVIPNFRAVSADTKLPPQTVKEKFADATDDSFDYSSIFIPAALAGLAEARNSVPEFHQGAAGYARYFWHSAVDQTSENYLVEFIYPVVTHEDTRYYTLGHGSFMHRATYALSRTAITRSDSGAEVFNVSEVFGSGSAAGISNLYYPSRQRSFSSTASEWGIDLGIDSASFVFREFWPDINRTVLRSGQPRR